MMAGTRLFSRRRRRLAPFPRSDRSCASTTNESLMLFPHGFRYDEPALPRPESTVLSLKIKPRRVNDEASLAFSILFDNPLDQSNRALMDSSLLMRSEEHTSELQSQSNLV